MAIRLEYHRGQWVVVLTEEFTDAAPIDTWGFGDTVAAALRDLANVLDEGHAIGQHDTK